MKQQCQGCGYLNTEKKQTVGQAYRYGCGLRPDGYISTWINTDVLLSQINCTAPVDAEDEETQETDGTQMSIFDYPEVLP
ncbi:MAG: hypothetical protein K0R92_440 [Lachnospiraceae bacterium]|nr:hypothetical protein [Lachnospiraceae bacterium]